MDVVDQTNTLSKVFYEMKSVESVPPGHFAEQFIKDLTNDEVSDLSQIRWIFNGAKNPTNFRQNMMNAIDHLSLTDDLARKFVKEVERPTTTDLKELLKENFDDIFKIDM